MRVDDIPQGAATVDETCMVQIQQILDAYYDEFCRLVPVDDILNSLKIKRILSDRDVDNIRSKTHENDRINLLFDILRDHRGEKDFFTFCQLLQKHCVRIIQEFGTKLEMKVKRL